MFGDVLAVSCVGDANDSGAGLLSAGLLLLLPLGGRLVGDVGAVSGQGSAGGGSGVVGIIALLGLRRKFIDLVGGHESCCGFWIEPDFLFSFLVH